MKFTVLSGTNLIILDKPLSFKPNSYFVFNWGSEETYTSNAKVQTSNPDWEQEIEVRIPLHKITSADINQENFLSEKLSKNVSVTVFSKNIPKDEMDKMLLLSSNNSNTNIFVNNVSSQELLTGKNIVNPFATLNNLSPSVIMHRDEFIGETNISLFDILVSVLEERNYKFNSDLVHDGFYHIYNRKDNIVGQIHFRVAFEETLVLKFQEIFNWQNNKTNLSGFAFNNSNNVDYYNSNAIGNLIRSGNNNFCRLSTKFHSVAKGIDIVNSNKLSKNSNIKINSDYDLNFNNSGNGYFDSGKKKSLIAIDANNYNESNSIRSPVNSLNLEEIENELLWKKIKENEVTIIFCFL